MPHNTTLLFICPHNLGKYTSQHIHCVFFPQSWCFVLFSVSSYTYKGGCTVTALSAHRPVEHVNYDLQNIATEGMKHNVQHASYHQGCEKISNGFHLDRRSRCCWLHLDRRSWCRWGRSRRPRWCWCLSGGCTELFIRSVKNVCWHEITSSDVA